MLIGYLNTINIEFNILYDFIFCWLSSDEKCIINSNDRNNSMLTISAVNFIISNMLSNIAIYSNNAIMRLIIIQ